MTKFGSISEIGKHSVDELVAVGLTEETAADVIKAIGKSGRASSSRKSAQKAPKETAPVEMVEIHRDHSLTGRALELQKIGESKNISLPPKIYTDIAKKIENADLPKKKLEELVVVADRMFRGHMMAQNESAGIMAAHSIGEPGTQMNLRTFHFAGDSFLSVTRGLPRLIEIVDAHADPLTPSMTVPLREPARSDESIAKRISSNIEITRLSSIASIDTDVTNARLIVRTDPASLDDKGISQDDVIDILSSAKALKGCVETEGFDIVITATDGSYKKLQQMYDAVRNMKIKGIDGIKQSFIRKDEDENGVYYTIITDGSNLKEILTIPEVDAPNVKTNSIVEIASVLGIEAARNAIIEEAFGTLEEAGLNIDIRHIMMVADLMTNDGTVRSIGRNGISGTKSSVLSRAAFEITSMHLLHAAIVGEVDHLKGVTENIIVGQPVTLGTGAVNLQYEPGKYKMHRRDNE